MRAPEGKGRIYITRRGFVAALQGMNVTLVIDAMIEMGALKGSVKLSRLDAAKARENVNATALILWEVPPA